MARERCEFVIVGAGLLGQSTARALRRRGRDVVVLEQETPGHARGGSKGASRIFRLGYPDRMYIRMAMRARTMWTELERETGRELLTPTPQITFGADREPLLRAMTDTHAPVHAISGAEARRMYPQLRIQGDALLEPDSAVIDVPAVFDALRTPTIERTRVERIDDDGTHVTVRATDRTYEANVAVVCTGPWSATTPGPAKAKPGTFATLEHVAYFGPLSEPMPIFIEHGRPAAYGLPTPALHAYKIGFHHAGDVVNPDTDALDALPQRVDELVAAARRLFPDFDPAPVLVETCCYDNTSNEDFVLDRVGNVVIGAGTSGHGFKFGPLLGELLADLAIGKQPSVELSRFRLSSDRSRR